MGVDATPGFRRFICETCGFIFDEVKGDPVGGIAPGTCFEDIPDDWICSLCGDPKSAFSLLAEGSSIGHSGIDSVGENQGRVVVIGSGIAGWRAVEAIRRRSTDLPITMITKSSGDHYNRPGLSKNIGGDISDLIFTDAKTKSQTFAVNLMAECEVLGIDKSKKRIITDQGVVPFQQLILATGSSTPELAQCKSVNVFKVDQLEDFSLLNRRLSPDDRIAVIGGGLIGCELADSLSRANYSVTLVNSGDHLLAQQVPLPVSNRLAEVFEKNGIELLLAHHFSGAFDQGGQVIVELNNDVQRSFDKVVICIGTKANTDVARRAGLEVGRTGLCVDQYMRVWGKDVFALGDCVEFNGIACRYLSPIGRQADVISEMITEGKSSQPFEISTNLIKAKIGSFPIVIYQWELDPAFDSWRLLRDCQDSIVVEMVNRDKVVGIVAAGDSPDEGFTEERNLLKKSVVRG